MNVLLIEDNADDALLLERHLRRNGFVVEITRVETSAEMQEALGRLPPDIVLADYNLPNFSGPAALKLLQANGVDIPFIMLSGEVSEESAVIWPELLRSTNLRSPGWALPDLAVEV